MLPLVEKSVLSNNPEFAALYKNLTTNVLNSDGSTKNDASTKERDRIRQELRNHRLLAAKRHLITHALATAVPTEPKPASTNKSTTGTRRPRTDPSSDLPEAVLDLLVLLPAVLYPDTTTLDPSATRLLLSHPPFSDLPTLFPHLTRLAASVLRSAAVQLTRLASPATNPSFLHRVVATALPTHVANLHASRADLQTRLSSARDAAAGSVVALLATRARVLAELVRALEAKHGPVAHALEGRAAEAALDAACVEAEAAGALGRVRAVIYTPDATRALAGYAAHLGDARARLAEAMRNGRALLAEYGVSQEGEDNGKERTMKEMARVYREMRGQLDEVRGDLERLDRA